MPRERSLVQRSRLLGERILLRERIPQTRDLSAGQSGEPLKRDQLPDLEIRIREFQGTNLANLAGSAGFRDRGGERACLPLFSLIAIESIAGDSRLAFRNVSATPPPPPPPPYAKRRRVTAGRACIKLACLAAARRNMQMPILMHNRGSYRDEKRSLPSAIRYFYRFATRLPLRNRARGWSRSIRV